MYCTEYLQIKIRNIAKTNSVSSVDCFEATLLIDIIFFILLLFTLGPKVELWYEIQKNNICIEYHTYLVMISYEVPGQSQQLLISKFGSLKKMCCQVDTIN